jgi:nitrogen fixation protein FixH
MKINWGTGIVIAFALFMAFILFFVFRVQSDSKYDNELVIEEYYKQEQILEQQLDKEKNAVALVHQVHIENQGNDINISFPEEFEYKKITGKVSLYRPSDKKLDFEMPISLSGHHLLIPKSDLAGGRWDITVDWQYGGKAYRNKQMLTL